MLFPVLLAPQSNPTEIVFRSGLAIDSVGRGGRTPVQTDLVADQIVNGTWTAPIENAKLGERTWTPINAGTDGTFNGAALRGGYVFTIIDSPSERTMILNAAGHNLVYVNGEPRAGDPYGFGYLQTPVRLRKGKNEFLFTASRGRLTAKLSAPKAPIAFNASDLTVPDFVVGESDRLLVAVPVINATSEVGTGHEIRATIGQDSGRTVLPPVLPMSARKVGIELPRFRPTASGEVLVRLEIVNVGTKNVLDQMELRLQAKAPTSVHRRTFRSKIDGSVQYYAVQPSRNLKDGNALVLSVHGASVEALNQANAYGQKDWATIVCPTNRRPYGFDWEEWGRMDAMEVLADAEARYRPDPTRVFLSGHSMGGHGTWHLGVTYPDRFAAIGPSAGWISFFTYGGGRRDENPDAIGTILQRATAPSDTLNRLHNLANTGVYILHSDKDESVPVAQAREMAKNLGEFHRDWQYFEKQGAGHWWDDDEEPGASCLDWPPMFDLFSRRRLAPLQEVRFVDFVTVNPGVSARSHWVSILQQSRALMPSRVKFRFDPGQRSFTGTTENSEQVRFDVSGVDQGEVTLKVDGSVLKLPYPAVSKTITIAKTATGWVESPVPNLFEKGPHRSGPLKELMQNRIVFVYGTQGSGAETAWSKAKALFDAEQFGYRGNGSVDVVADTNVGREHRDRTLVLYGNADTNSQWKPNLSRAGIRIDRKTIEFGGRRWTGDFAMAFAVPRPGSESAAIVAFAGTSLVGCRTLDRFPIFTSGAAYPDWILVKSDFYQRGASSIVGAGFFGNRWEFDESQSSFRL